MELQRFDATKYYLDSWAASFGRKESSIVRGVYYSNEDNELLVALHEDAWPFSKSKEWNWFLYHDVPAREFDDLVTSTSLGARYNSIKSLYGPGTKIDNPPFIGTGEGVQSPRRLHEVNQHISASTPGKTEYYMAASAAADTDNDREYVLDYVWKGSNMPTVTRKAESDVVAIQNFAAELRDFGLHGATIVSVTRRVNQSV